MCRYMRWPASIKLTDLQETRPVWRESKVKWLGRWCLSLVPAIQSITLTSDLDPYCSSATSNQQPATVHMHCGRRLPLMGRSLARAFAFPILLTRHRVAPAPTRPSTCKSQVSEAIVLLFSHTPKLVPKEYRWLFIVTHIFLLEVKTPRDIQDV